MRGNKVCPLTAAAAAILLCGMTQTAQAATLTVSGACTLDEAITAARTNAHTASCTGEGAYGDDTIVLSADANLVAALQNIEAATGVVTINGGGHFIQGGAPGGFSILRVAAGGKLILQNVTVRGGSATYGGGIHNSGTLIVKDSTITGNTASNGGGGIYSDGGTVSLENSTVANNSTPGNIGGGLYVVGAGAAATVTIDSSTISSNTASGGGGGIAAVNNGGAGVNVTLNNSTVSGNSTPNICGGFFISSASTNVTLNNTTVSSNTGSFQSGGLFVNDGAAVTLNYSIVSGNNGNNSGNEVLNNGGTGTVNANNNNVFGHSGEVNLQAYNNFTPGATDVNATSDGSNTPLANIIGDLASNGGPTQTHALPSGSPAIDKGGATCPNNAYADQRGYTRPINFKCDAGAYEYSAAYSADCGNGHDLAASIWLMSAPPCKPNLADTSIAFNYGSSIPGGSYSINWVGYRWNHSPPQKYVVMMDAVPLVVGEGNWLYSTIAAPVGMTGPATGTETCSTYGSGLSGNCHAIILAPYANPAPASSFWQMAGHPFPYTVNWADVRVATCASDCENTANWTQRTPSEAQVIDIMSKTWWRYNNTGSGYESYDDSTLGMIGTLRPSESFWVKMLPGSAGLMVRLLIPARSVL